MRTGFTGLAMDLTKDTWQSNHYGESMVVLYQIVPNFQTVWDNNKNDSLFINFKGPMRQSIKAHKVIPGIY